MLKLDDKKIKEGLRTGKLIDYDELFASYPKEKQEKILSGAKHLIAAMRVRKLRKEMKISQKELAEKMKVKREYIARIESGKQNITLDTLYKIADATGKKFRFWFE